MKIKKEYIFLFFIIAALTIYLAVQSQTRTHLTVPEIPEIASTEITKVEIRRPENTIVLKRNGNNWEIGPNKYKADTDTVNHILDIIGTLSLTALVSKSKNYERYDLNSGNKISIKAWAGETLRREFTIGKPAPSYRHTFVTIPDDEYVYHALNNFRHTFEKPIDGMRDKTIFFFDKKDIYHIDIESDRVTASFYRQLPAKKGEENQKMAAGTGFSDKWFNAEDQIVDLSIIDPLLNTLSNLKCASYVPDRTKDDFTDPIYTVTLKGKKTYTLCIFNKINPDDEKYPAVSSQTEYVFNLSKWVADKLMKKTDNTNKNN
jgi:hypothetical protein